MQLLCVHAWPAGGSAAPLKDCLHTGNQLKTDGVTHHPVDVCPFVEQPFCCLQVTPLGSIVQAGDRLRRRLQQQQQQ